MRRRVWLVLSFVACLCVLDALWLCMLQRDLESFASYCHLAEGFDCMPALKSRYGKLYGMPLSNLSVGFYLFVFGLAIQPLINPVRADRNSFFLVLLNGFGVLFSARMAYISHVILKAYCPFCMILQVLSPVLFLLSLFLFMKSRTPPREIIAAEWESIRKNKVIAFGTVVAAVLAFAGIPYINYLGRLRLIEANPIYQQIMSGDYPRFDSLHELLGERPFRGNPSAKVVIVEFGDFLCPVCRASHELFKELVQVHDAKFIFVPFPRSMECNPYAESTMPGSCFAALVAEYAARRGKFWEVHDAIMKDDGLLKQERANELARMAGAPDAAALMSDTQAAFDLQRDVAIANMADVKHPPTLFINGMGLEGIPEDWFLYDVIRREEGR